MMQFVQLVLIIGIRVVQAAFAPLFLPYSLLFAAIYYFIVIACRVPSFIGSQDISYIPFPWHWNGIPEASTEFTGVKRQPNEEVDRFMDVQNTKQFKSLKDNERNGSIEDLNRPLAQKLGFVARVKKALKPRNSNFEL
jgi:hypothetical protein